MGEFTVNFIAFEEARNACIMVLVEGPWSGATDDHLRSLQDRMYGCLEAALDGQLAKQFPQSVGMTVVVRVDCHDVPRNDVDGFICRFKAGISALPDYSAEGSPYLTGFRFEVNHDSVTR
jgi:hypothetical protein